MLLNGLMKYPSVYVINFLELLAREVQPCTDSTTVSYYTNGTGRVDTMIEDSMIMNLSHATL